MRPALPYYYTLYRRAANGTGLTGALVDAKIILKIAAAVDPVDAGAIAADALFQDVTDSLQQAGCLCLIHEVGRSQRMKSRQMQGFIRVNITQSCQKALVEQKRFELAPGKVQALVKSGG
jgi:hypothetical protein